MSVDEIRSKIAKRSSQKGGEGERGAAKQIAAYFGIAWGDAFIRTKKTSGGQPLGDIMPIKEMWNIWHKAGFGTLECKNRMEWDLHQVFKQPDSNKLAEYWFKSRDDTHDETTVVVFTKSGTPYYILHVNDDFHYTSPVLVFTSKGYRFIILKLSDFLLERWPHA